MRRYIIYCDESADKGEFFSNFYGGALVQGEHLQIVEETLLQRVRELGLTGEIKWSKTSESTHERYIRLIETFFDFIDAGYIKIRIMFTQTAYEARGLTDQQRKQTFHRLYYQFIKHAFGLQFSNPTRSSVGLQVLFDELPTGGENRTRFKKFIMELQNQQEFKAAKIVMAPDDLQEVVSHSHIILQCLDVVLGSMNFRLNDFHRKKPEGQRYRGKKTVIKHQLYKYIYQRVCKIRPKFNIGCNTGTDNDITNRWRHPYRHWLFIPNDHNFHPDQTKRRPKKESPTASNYDPK